MVLVVIATGYKLHRGPRHTTRNNVQFVSGRYLAGPEAAPTTGRISEWRSEEAYRGGGMATTHREKLKVELIVKY